MKNKQGSKKRGVQRKSSVETELKLDIYNLGVKCDFTLFKISVDMHKHNYNTRTSLAVLLES